MAHIGLPEEMPGITAGFAFRPETAKPMRELAHVLLHESGNEGFTSGERELVAASCRRGIRAISARRVMARQRRICMAAMLPW